MILEGNIDGFLKGSIETTGKNPVINELNVSKNGIYMPDPGVDGFAPVNVNVSGPLLDTLNVIENGTYTPPSNIDGFNEVVVNVPIPTFSTDELNAIANGEYTPPSGVDGFSKVIVNVPKTPLNKLTVTENGTYTAPTDTGYDEVNVNVPLPSNAYLLKEIEDIDIASFSDGSNLPMPKLQVAIEPQQEGSGDPSPTNVRPISGWDKVNVTVADDVETPTVSNVYTIDLDGTRYGGTLDVVSGVLTVDRVAVSLGNIDYTKSQSGLFQTNEIANNVKKNSYSYTPTGFIKSSHFREIDSASITGPQGSNPSPDGVMALNSAGILYFNYTAVTDVADFKTAMTSATLVYELATPQTIQLTPTQIKSLLGSNNVWADTGSINNIEYFAK